MKEVLDLTGGWRSRLRVESDELAVFTRDQAVHATMLFMAGQLSVEECGLWADYILSNNHVSIESARAYELLEFVQDWSSETSIPIDRASVEVWQSRFAHD